MRLGQICNVNATHVVLGWTDLAGLRRGPAHGLGVQDSIIIHVALLFDDTNWIPFIVECALVRSTTLLSQTESA